MEEIKFRLILDNEIVVGYEVHKKTDSNRIVVEHQDLDGNKVFIHEYPDGYIEHDTKLIYTGLNDKYGTELYEYDIIRKDPNDQYFKYFGENKDSLDIAEIRFGYHEVMSDDPYCWGIGYGFYCCGFHNEGIGGNFYNIEVIGNKFENPDLHEKIGVNYGFK